MRILFLDCLSGISGDMLAGALLDLGLPLDHLKQELGKLGLDDEFHLHIHRAQKQNIEGVKFDVHESHAHAHEPSSTHDHSGKDHHHHHAPNHEHHDHRHGRGFAEIRQLINQSTLTDGVKKAAVAIFHRIAVAEGKIHGHAPEDVTFHEVGAVDSIVDIITAAIGLEWLAVDEVHCSPLFEGRGWINCAHGKFPLPAPATQEILRDVPLRQIDEEMEFITPTGAAIVAEIVTRFGLQPAMRSLAVGYGLGTRETSPRPNLLRVILAETEEESSPADIVELQTNLDDTSPELTGHLVSELLKQPGVLDVFCTPVQMKQNRPGFLISVLCRPASACDLSHYLLRHSTAFGVRQHPCRRIVLEREVRSVETAYGPVEIKIGRMAGEVWQRTPEFASCLAAAERSGQPVNQVYKAAIAAALELKL